MSTTMTHVWRPSTARRVVLDGFAPVPRGVVQAAPLPLAWPAKDPADVLDYELDISAALVGNEGDGIAAVNATVSPAAAGDLALTAMAADGAVAVFWFSGGVAGTTYTVQVTIGTAAGRTLSRVLLLPVLSLSSVAAASSALTTALGAVMTDQFGNPILLGA